jgi:2-polyprenyl-6-methoxyphenol hydroxylase-like FAD-dependent oxidoreductase
MNMKKIISISITLLLWSISPLFANHDPISVLVIGGGPAGLATAIEAADSGAQVTVVEKRKSYSRGQSVFLVDSSIKLLEKWKVTIPEMKAADLGEGGKFGLVPINQLEQGLLKRVNELGIKVIHGEFKRLERKKAVIASSEGEIPFLYDVLVGADGIHSHVREELGISCTSLGKAIGVWALMKFEGATGGFDVSPAIEKDNFLIRKITISPVSIFIRKITVSPVSIIFAQICNSDQISSKEFESLVRACGWKKEADMMASSKAKISDSIEIFLQQAKEFSNKQQAGILVGDAAATASFFQGMGINTALITASIAGDFFRNVNRNNNAYYIFNKDMEKTTDLLIEDSRFLFPSH